MMLTLLLQELRTASLARVVCDCMDDVDKLQPFLFLQPDTIANIRTRWGMVTTIFRESLPSPLDSHFTRV